MHDRIAGRHLVSNVEPSGRPAINPPSSNTGVISGTAVDGGVLPTGSQLSRERVSLSVSPELDAALASASIALGISKSQVALQAVMLGLPAIVSQVQALRALKG